MISLNKNSSIKLLLISLASAIFCIYPNIACLRWELSYLDGVQKTVYLWFFAFRYVFFVILIWILLIVNLRKLQAPNISKRLLINIAITIVAYAVYFVISQEYSRVYCTKSDCFGSILLFQFVVVYVLSFLVGHMAVMYSERNKKEHEIEQLKIENLQSKCDALANQINPHFFFNSLNGITALVRKGDDERTLAYVNKLSDAFRYILQSDKKGLVSLREELTSVDAFKYMMEERFANKLIFNINIDVSKLHLKIPALSILPLLDNVVVHNIIDSQNKMTVDITVNKNNELVVTNPIQPKLTAPETNGTGIANLKKRFNILMDRHIKIENDGKTFTVFLPLGG
ncbi:MAG: sensor histidine kinase [Bacteroidales bacterium]